MLRVYRKQHRMSQAEVGRLVAVDHKTVSNWEANRNHPPVDALRTLDATWRTGGLFEALHHFASTTQAPAQFLAFAEYEALATVLRINGIAFIPGLLQTPDYARAAFTLAGVADVEGQIAQRMARQALILRDDAPYVSVVLAESALLVIPPSARAEQLARLAEVADLPNVTLRLVPLSAGPHPGLVGSFYLSTTPEREVGFVETPARGRLVTETDDLRRLTVAFDRASGHALSAEATRERLRQMVEEAQSDPVEEVQP
ncbi:helix-turn-helix domain-containing protein [Actinomadura terrae]|uniref:helix-turn-helix domain-containing protein n=1 Tax=Actinomadura terrae TaxID=604353 RepID=UPI002342CD6E|nr:helix-turn-helix transcriptional regulator [Actinomadura terrae]